MQNETNSFDLQVELTCGKHAQTNTPRTPLNPTGHHKRDSDVNQN